MRKIDTASDDRRPGGDYLRQSDDRWNGYDGCGPEREKRRNAFQEQRALSWNECGGQPYILPQNGKDAGCRDREKSGWDCGDPENRWNP